MKKRSALFFDIDGTLLSEKTKEIPASTVRALQKAKQEGHAVFINTGRTLCSVPVKIKRLAFDGLICTDEKSRKEEFFQAIDKDLIPLDRQKGVYECIQKGYSKATAIEVMRRHLELSMDQIYVFGDSSNDLSMFEYAKHTVAMGEHDLVLEPYTEYITDAVEQDGIEKAMEYYRLI